MSARRGASVTQVRVGVRRAGEHTSGYAAQSSRCVVSFVKSTWTCSAVDLNTGDVHVGLCRWAGFLCCCYTLRAQKHEARRKSTNTLENIV